MFRAGSDPTPDRATAECRDRAADGGPASVAAAAAERLEVERYELHAPGIYGCSPDRRLFVQAVGSGIVLSAVLAGARPATGQSGRSARRDEQLGERFHVGMDGLITVRTSKVEVGQGARTQLAQAVAEELHLPLERIRVEMADTAHSPDDGGTAGSRTTPATVPRVRQAAAVLRQLLVRLAAEKFAVDPEQLTLDDGVLMLAGKRLTDLMELAGDPQWVQRWSTQRPVEPPPLVPPDQWRVLGRSPPKLEAVAVVTGRARYPSDISLPGMRYGAVLRPASFGAQLIGIDLSAAGQRAGVQMVQDGDFVGCVADSSWQAAQACRAVAATAQWQRPEHPSSDSLFEYLKQTARRGAGERSRSRGDVANQLAGARQQLSVSYRVAYIQHAPLEPRAAVARWTGNQLTVWTGTQQPARVHSELSLAFRLPAEQVQVIVPDTGGGFGGKHTGEVAVEAARLAKAADAPVSLRWSRQEEFTWAYFRPAGLIEIQAGLDADGRIQAWDFTNYNSGGSAIESPYTIAHAASRFLATESPLRQGSYRALASTANTFARESCMDELAALAGEDPLAFRLQHLPEGRLKDVLRAAAEQFDWVGRNGRLADNHGIGLACGTEKGSFVAACVEVQVVGDQIHLREVCQAFECGAIQNPENLRAQVEGSIIMGLGAALWEEMQFRDGQIRNDSFSSYRVPRMSDLPKLNVVLLDRPDLPSVGGSETPIIAIAPAIANACYRAVKVRARSLPLRLG